MMNKYKLLGLLVAMVVVCGTLQAKPKSYRLASPDGKLVSNIVFSAEEGVTYDIVCDGVTLMRPSHIGLTRLVASGRALVSSLELVRASRVRFAIEPVPSPFTRQAEMYSSYNEMIFTLKDGLSLVFRAYDNGGVAYRFVSAKECIVRSETVEYNFAEDFTATAPYVSAFDEKSPDVQYSTSFENLYTTLPLSQLDSRRLCFLPLLVHGPQGIKICLTETALHNFPGLYLKGTGQSGQLVGDHARYPKRVEQGGHNNLQMLVKEREDFIAKVPAGAKLPWRIAMVARDDRQLAMNNLSYLLADPCRLTDISWIKPGKVAWDWWNNWNIEGVDFKAGINNDTYKYYIDFASKNGIEYVILDEGWAVNMKADLFQVVPEIDLPMLVRYAEERNVGLILWAGYYAFDRDMERVCQHYSDMGIKGFKIDFMDRDDQVVTDFYYRAAAMCAKYQLVADFHGAFKPAGLNRTYPNVLNFEGVAGLEQLKWAPSTWDQVQYDTELPFIRQTAGSMDYTQGAMHNAAKGCYFPCWSEPMSQGTRCHQLALYVVLESPLNMMCDAPTNYEKEKECTKLIASIPTTWDETYVLDGKVGEYIVTARRKGDVWYVGGITNWTPRDLDVNLSQLGNVEEYVYYVDGKNADRKGSDYQAMSVTVINQNNSDKDIVETVHLAPGGGFLMKVVAKGPHTFGTHLY